MFKNIDNSISGVSSKQIIKLKEIIDGKLPSDYIEYLKQYGFVSLKGRDVFGLGNEKFFNALKKTKELQDNFGLKKNFVVLEDVGTESMYLVLNTINGSVYEWTPSGNVKKIYESFKDYVENDF
ncbi:SMI1/KNR4 family protein [Algibacter sp. L3A6]|uniref:SMI1/KNR4 family protein n=1 Tax=Algibacter sp. L3A6 TaxID=2686366 RepID=UPI00131DC4D3|nr:SMI1/KNR4 family protein [Algibacter sp. L3A6]